MIHGKSLQPSNLDGLLAFLDHHTRALAEHFGRTNSSAACAEDIRLEDHARRPAHIRRHDPLDEPRHIDPRRARLNTRRVKTVEATGRFDGRLPRVHRRRDVREILFVLLRGKFRRGFAQGHALSSCLWSPLKHTARWTYFPTGHRGQISSAILALPDKSNRWRICNHAAKAASGLGFSLRGLVGASTTEL